ncbi:MAG TPA: hypothetical protein VGL77_21420, partial [Armatimonadota bacterium]
VDGHTGWQSAQSITPLFFVPSVIDASNVLPISLGEMYHEVSKNSVYGSLSNLGITIGMGTLQAETTVANVVFTNATGSTTQAWNSTTGIIGAGSGVPSWWKVGPGGTILLSATTYASKNPNNDWLASAATPWGTSSVYALNGTTAATIPTQTLTIVPNVSQPTLKLMALVTGAYYGDQKVIISSVQLGTNPAITSFTPEPSASIKYNGSVCSPNRSVTGMLLPVKPGQNITITYKADAMIGYASKGLFLAFEN